MVGEAAELATQVANGRGCMVYLAESGEIDICEALGANHLAMFAVNIHVALLIIEMVEEPFPLLDDHFLGNRDPGYLVSGPVKWSGERPRYAGAYSVRSETQPAFKPPA